MLQSLCQLARSCSQQFAGFGNRTSQLVNAVKHPADFQVLVRATDNGEDPLAKFVSKPRHAGGGFAFQGLSIQTSFAGNYNVRASDFFFQANGSGHNIKTSFELGVAKALQTEAKTTGCTGAGCFAEITAKIALNYIG